MKEVKSNPLVIGCNYHTKWQTHRNMRFVLKDIKGEKALLITRKTKKEFWTNVSDLIFITTRHNINKSEQLKTK